MLAVAAGGMTPSIAHATEIREVITIAIGTGGVEAADQYWQEMAAGYGIQSDGMMPSDPTVGIEDDEWNVHFSESGAGRHRPRAIFIGSEPSSIDAIRTGSWRQLYIPEQLISGQYACYDSLSETDNGLYCGVPDDEITSAEGEAYFAEVNDLALDRIRRLADNTTGLAGFRVISSAEEGFGSGAGKFLLESLAAEYPTKSIHTYTVLPPRSSLDGSAIVTYNALFALAPTEQIASRAYVFGADTIETDVQAAVVASLLADSPYNFADNVGDGLTFVGKIPKGTSFSDYTGYLVTSFRDYYVDADSVSSFTDLLLSRLTVWQEGVDTPPTGTYPGLPVSEFCSTLAYFGVVEAECEDTDGDGTPDNYDVCPADPTNADTDGDLVCDSSDVCIGDNSTGDEDGDQICGDLDLCFGSDATGDTEPDGYCNDVDVCPTISDDQTDTDGDGKGNACEADDDGDGLADKADNCPVDYNVDQANTDGDGQGDACDGDDDADGVLDAADNCALVGNPSQANFDGDGNGDACDGDDDADAIADQSDACPATSLSSLVDSRGCSGVQYVALTCSTTTTWKNHGAYVSCVSSAARAAKASGLLSKDESGVIVSTAAKSTIGK